MEKKIMKFQSPLSRGTPPDVVKTMKSKETELFQSPLSRGTPPDNHGKNLPARIGAVSIPSKSGHSSRLLATNLTQGENRIMFQSPLSRGTPPDLKELHLVCKHNVSIPSKSGHSSRLLKNRSTWTSSRVSIPSKSGHSSRPAMNNEMPDEDLPF